MSLAGPAGGPALTPVAADRGLRAPLRAGSGVGVLTGGQTGVDTFAALAALRVGLATHLLFPHGYLQEDGPISAARRRQFLGASLRELSLAEFGYRTWTCVYLSDAVVLLDPAGGDGCQETARAAESFGRPLLAPIRDPDAELLTSDRIADWLRETGTRLLMVAGCRGSLLSAAGLTAKVRHQVGVIARGARQRHDELTRDPT